MTLLDNSPGASTPTRHAKAGRREQSQEMVDVSVASFSKQMSGAFATFGELSKFSLATFRAMGLEDTARRAAIQLMILSDEGAPL